MQWTIPGTVLKEPIEDAGLVENKFSSMFLAGGIVLSQVAQLTGLEPHTVQNWVKRGYLAPPVKKRYSLRQLCRIININTLKSILPLEDICNLLTYVNGELDDESDDLIDDSALYFLFLRLAATDRLAQNRDNYEACLDQALQDYREPVPGAKERVKNVLRVMLTAWAAARLRQKAESLMQTLKVKE